jgi:peptidoglycan/xylan/chitin deacetylase (PgdA/CDA1 family)
LIALGYGHLLTTGVFDEATRREVVAFQTDAGLINDGVIDFRTQQALAAAQPNSRPTPPVPPHNAAGPNVVYLGFAGGPGLATPQVLDALHRRSAMATFFIDDSDGLRHSDVLRSITAAGDGLGIALPPHVGTSPIAVDAMWRSAARTRDDLSALVGRNAPCMVAPYGATTPNALSQAGDLNLKVVLWDIDPQDWRRPGPLVISNDVIDNVHPGSVVLLHDGGGDRSQTVAALTTILDTLSQRGYSFAAIPGCLAT